MANRKNIGIPMTEQPGRTLKSALLFINGEPPAALPSTADYDIIACTDGALGYLFRSDFPLEQLHFISGDLDSIPPNLAPEISGKLICTPEQDRTDFEKALDLLHQNKVGKVHVFGASGEEMDHFLGNLTAAYRYFHKMDIRFFDAFAEYFFIPENFELSGVQGRMISLYPFPVAGNVQTTGLNWELEGETLDLVRKIGTRNFAVCHTVKIRFSEGALLLFIGQNYRKI